MPTHLKIISEHRQLEAFPENTGMIAIIQEMTVSDAVMPQQASPWLTTPRAAPLCPKIWAWLPILFALRQPVAQ